MKYRWLLSLLLSLSAANAQSFQSSIEIIEQFDDLRLVAFIKQSDIADYPLWQALKDAPPLSIEQAIQAITDLKAVNHETLSAGSVDEIELRQISGHKNHWHYLIKINNESSGKDKAEVYIVLMNGKVIPALIETESYK